MLLPQSTTQPGGPAVPARPVPITGARVRRRRAIDRLARAFVSLGGTVIILSILAILAVIVIEIAPLFRGASASAEARIALKSGAAPIAVGLDDYRQYLYTVDWLGLRLWRLQDGTSLPLQLDLAGATVTGISDRGRGSLALGLDDGRAMVLSVGFSVSFSQKEGKRETTGRLTPIGLVNVNATSQALRVLAHAPLDEGLLVAGAVGPREIALVASRRKKSLVGPGKLEERRHEIPLGLDGEIRALALDGRGDDLFVGSSKGEILRVDLRDASNPRVAETRSQATRGGAAVSVLGFLLGDRTLVVGDDAGGVRSWQLLRPPGGNLELTPIYEFKPHAEKVLGVSISERDKGFLTADAAGGIELHYGTTGQTILSLTAPNPGVRAVALAPKADGAVAVDGSGGVTRWTIDNPHPEATMKSLFGKIWYEGYEKPECVWQSTGGTDDFESKFSLTPLLVGTLKGTFYSLIMAVPIALLSALYVSQFMHPVLKGYVKPVVEVMAALPSVVLGFIAGLWLAPRVEKAAPGIALMPLVTAGLILATLFSWRAIPLRYRRHVKHGTEVGLLLPVVVAGILVSLAIGAWLDASLPCGDYRRWLRSAFGITYDQRNSLVVGFAMGFAVIPIIFTIAEDALTNVPPHLSAGSLALGATRWQTALHVVLPTASPGIFSAVMIGFGRAVGETMIVVMATGNTPIMNLSPFNGFRALSANVAVELPEAPVGGTLFRVLFLAAFLLFVMTFIVNTLAEAIRLRLRKRYQCL